jgi:dipeptidyl aminopeptidase/acylaminoacyl peptidase
MTGRRRLAAVPDRLDQQVLDWLTEPEAADASRPLEVAFAELANVRQLRPWPWTRLTDRLRPEPFGSPQARTIALVVAASLLLTLLATTWLTVGQQPQQTIPAVVPPVPTASASTAVTATAPPSVGPFPLASPGYAVIVGDGSGVFTIRTDGTGRRQVATELTGRLVSPEWGPDGTRALALEQTSSSEQVWDVDTAGTRRPLVIIPCVAPCQSRNEASWSHDGTSIVFFQALGEVVNGIPTTCGLARYEVATLAITSVTSSPCAVIEERHPRFSPDDASLAFWRSRSPGRVPIDQIEDSAIFTRDLTTGRETQVTDWSIHASMLDWSPDGQWIAFIPEYWNGAAGGADIWRVHPDGSGLERMTSLDTAAVRILLPRYTPDGKWLLFVRVTPGATSRGELLAIPASGGTPVAVLPGTNVLDFDVRAVGP